MRYEIEQIELGHKLTQAKITVFNSEGLVTLVGEQLVCAPKGDSVITYIEDYYLIDQRRQPESTITDLALPFDICEAKRLEQEELNRQSMEEATKLAQEAQPKIEV